MNITEYINSEHCRFTETPVEKAEFLNRDIISIDGENITSLHGIDVFVNLKILWVTRNELTSLEGIENMHKLEDIYASDNKLKNFDQLGNLPNIVSINLQENFDITYIPDLSNCTSLTTLNLNNCNVKSIKPIKKIPNLQHFTACNNEISDLMEMEMYLPQLKSFHLQGNPFPADYPGLPGKGAYPQNQEEINDKIWIYEYIRYTNLLFNIK